MSPTIIVGFDGSNGGRDALALGAVLRDATGARLMAVSAYEHRSFTASAPAERSPSAVREAMPNSPQRKRAAGSTTRHDQSPAWPGPPRLRVRCTRLRCASRPTWCSSGSTSRGTLGRVLAGSVGERLLHGAPCAVGLAPSGFARAASAGVLRPVGAAFDGSAESRAALATAADLAGALGGELRAISVFDRPSPAHPMFAVTSYRAFVEDLEDEHRSRLLDAITTLAAGVAVEPIVVQGEPVAVLAEQSRALGLLVLGSRGYGPLRQCSSERSRAICSSARPARRSSCRVESSERLQHGRSMLASSARMSGLGAADCDLRAGQPARSRSAPLEARTRRLGSQRNATGAGGTEANHPRVPRPRYR